MKKNPDAFLESLEDDLTKIAARIRSYSRRQWRTWQKIPYASLNREGRGGWSGGEVYRTGYLLAHACNSRPATFVDLENGELVCSDGSRADDHDVVSLLTKFHVLNAQRHLDEIAERTPLERPNGMPYSEWEYGKTKRVELAREYGIRPDRYSRQKLPAKKTA